MDFSDVPCPAADGVRNAAKGFVLTAARVAVVGALCFFVAAAHGQVVRCTDPKTGQVTYTDAGCAPSERAVDILRRQTPEEATRERAQAAEARRRVNREIAALSARQAAERVAMAPAVSIGGGGGGGGRTANKTSTQACATATSNYDFASSSRTKTSEQLSALLATAEIACGVDSSGSASPQRLQVPSHRPTILSSCDPGGCWDTNGGRYNRAGPNLIDPMGRVCHGTGATMTCQ